MAKVVIELEFDASNGRKVLNCDVWDYLEELIEDESLDYTVYDGDETYYIEKDKMLKLLIMANVNWTDLNNSSGEYRKVIFLPTKYYKRYFKSNLY